MIAILLRQRARLQADEVGQAAAGRHRLQVDEILGIIGDIRLNRDIRVGFVEGGDHRLGRGDHGAPGAETNDHIVLGEKRRANRQDEQDANWRVKLFCTSSFS